ncbi:hypothetical protein BHM03_00000002 [Ensete ventricosum]|nr:hypothetical protein BHM03_00000002 [Ensete ventricosum]
MPTTGRTADLTQLRSAPPTYKRTPHCNDDKHGGGHDGMVEGTMACAHGPELTSACSPKLGGGIHPRPHDDALHIICVALPPPACFEGYRKRDPKCNV